MNGNEEPDTKKRDVISVRPPKAIRPKLFQMAAELDKSEGEFATACIKAVMQMIESEEVGIPPLVTAARTLRVHGATMTAPPRPVSSADARDKREISVGYPAHPDTDFYSEICAGKSQAVAFDATPEKIDIPAGVARLADFAVVVRGDSMEPLISENEVAVFRRAEVAGNGQIVAAVVEGQLLLKRFMQKNGGPARLESFNPKHKPIPYTPEVRIQGIYEGKFDPHHKIAV